MTGVTGNANLGAQTVTGFVGFSSTSSFSTTEVNRNMVFPINGIAITMILNLGSNTMDNVTTYTLRFNGASTSLTFTVPDNSGNANFTATGSIPFVLGTIFVSMIE